MKCMITAIGSMSAEAVIQAVARRRGAVVVGCNSYPKEWTAASRLVEYFHQVPSARNSAEFVSRLLEICVSEQITHVVPLTDLEVDALSADRHRFDEMGVTLCISPSPVIQVARDKLALHQRFASHPRIRPIPTLDLQDERQFSFSYPLLAKPRRGRSSEGQVDIPDVVALQFWRAKLTQQDYIVQPRCFGDVFVVDIVRQPDGRRSIAMTRRELLRTPNGAGMAVQMQPGHPCDALGLEVAESLGLYGCVNMEFLVVDGNPLLMDVNPRFSAGVAFSMMAGYDMVANHLRCFEGDPILSCTPPEERTYTRSLIEYSL